MKFGWLFRIFSYIYIYRERLFFGGGLAFCGGIESHGH